jgi:hypothetical protein
LSLTYVPAVVMLIFFSSIWTHLFKEIEIIDEYYDPSTDYSGSAVKLGAGWQVADVYNTLAAVGKVIVAGECAVGFPDALFSGGPIADQIDCGIHRWICARWWSRTPLPNPWNGRR